ncbi:hypothetical protein E5E91_16090 (plasmid) [Deinococcus radiodurans R1 = ATCC 13939 = DSM 20539]|uniref:Uncharacterized protein n=1 Tax=Deinococcus radiodurans (strain ATCC 13939 / DSM 20539 / JCM 16871 / CCUG 27074 / LMG 4051 / NBRC 15346 / NCIMB 9279 / VKM B-1422 / R1) TaxID=243230 RepID=Q9RZM0_DEIRA|nr:hypothetical protein DR_B0105 [Deinococcus radiodurans R1 = ATCC 13939 = DSM 20539]ANC73311.1 hypothetical protein A2G07_15525 [Deinococcus radiodurans R1 = ATCC 13939 = DSM 20539]QEM73350.1 hypothetical protein DXG80_15715 [Deinococcus radiodurans]UDL02230.1 hypothetical protein E5E91_16090 [Deinococcus radiodurans R1 = ATCC 13939 = DSM 20539]
MIWTIHHRVLRGSREVLIGHGHAPAKEKGHNGQQKAVVRKEQQNSVPTAGHGWNKFSSTCLPT